MCAVKALLISCVELKYCCTFALAGEDKRQVLVCLTSKSQSASQGMNKSPGKRRNKPEQSGRSQIRKGRNPQGGLGMKKPKRKQKPIQDQGRNPRGLKH